MKTPTANSQKLRGSEAISILLFINFTTKLPMIPDNCAPVFHISNIIENDMQQIRDDITLKNETTWYFIN
jgi:hypothetical protein